MALRPQERLEDGQALRVHGLERVPVAFHRLEEGGETLDHPDGVLLAAGSHVRVVEGVGELVGDDARLAELPRRQVAAQEDVGGGVVGAAGAAGEDLLRVGLVQEDDVE